MTLDIGDLVAVASGDCDASGDRVGAGAGGGLQLASQPSTRQTDQRIGMTRKRVMGPFYTFWQVLLTVLPFDARRLSGYSYTRLVF